MLLYKNAISGMVHGVVFPPRGYFVETYCGVLVPSAEGVYEGDDMTCGACGIERRKVTEDHTLPLRTES